MADTVVLLRGLARGSQHWGGFVERVQLAFPARKVLAVDLAGNGLRFGETSPTSIEAAVADIRQQLQLAGLAPPYDVLGLSLGGMIGLEWQHLYPGEIGKLVVMNTSHGGMSTAVSRLRPLAMLRLLLAVLLPVYWREHMIYCLTSNRRPREAVIRHWIELATTQPVTLANVIRQLRIAHSFKRRLHSNRNGLLVLSSLYDRMVNVTCSRKIAAASGAPLHCHLVAGHEISLDDPRWVLQFLQQFLDTGH